ncbi:hypothetical protein F5B17DRAFT_381584 [Nemania serpens]|nr:hypothetical protein F5B17DRAFT_381584 [Nemania serpens]
MLLLTAKGLTHSPALNLEFFIVFLNRAVAGCSAYQSSHVGKISLNHASQFIFSLETSHSLHALSWRPTKQYSIRCLLQTYFTYHRLVAVTKDVL